jgi:SAM-dependent methyltransferase
MTPETVGKTTSDIASNSAPAGSDAERKALMAAVREWGYFRGSISNRKDLWAGKRILDVGMGTGLHSIGYIENGAISYVGVDPIVGEDKIFDFRSRDNASIPQYHAFPFSVADIERMYPNIHLYKGIVEDRTRDIRKHKLDFGMLTAVSEHLRNPAEAFRAVWELLQPGSYVWINHCNYYSWTGHHRPPRSVASWDKTSPEHNQNVDWKHLEPTHWGYTNPNFNRIRLEDIKVVISKYFDIVDWTVLVEALPRLTPQIRKKWKKYSLEELLGQHIYITGLRRDAPLNVTFDDRQLYHPEESYRADRDYSDEDLSAFDLVGSVFFSKRAELCSHTDNNFAGLRVFERLKPGDTITVRKFLSRHRYTVAEIVRPKGANARLRLVEPVPEEIINGNHDQWWIEI